MSLLKTASMGTLAFLRSSACTLEPTRPCSSPAQAMNTSVASNWMPLSANARASSIVSTVPLPSSLAPLASTLGSKSGRVCRSPPACGAGRRGIRLVLAADVDRVVVAADVDAARRASRQDRHHVAQIDLARDAALRRDDVRVEVDAQLLARAAHLLEDPVARRADALRRRLPDRTSVLRVPKLTSFVSSSLSRSSETDATIFSIRGSASGRGAVCAVARTSGIPNGAARTKSLEILSHPGIFSWASSAEQRHKGGKGRRLRHEERQQPFQQIDAAIGHFGAQVHNLQAQLTAFLAEAAARTVPSSRHSIRRLVHQIRRPERSSAYSHLDTSFSLVVLTTTRLIVELRFATRKASRPTRFNRSQKTAICSLYTVARFQFRFVRLAQPELLNLSGCRQRERIDDAMNRGTLNFAIRSRQNAWTSSGTIDAPGCSRSAAATSSPKNSLATAYTDASAIAGCVRSTSSTSFGAMFSPPRMMMSLMRPVIRTRPSRSIDA